MPPPSSPPPLLRKLSMPSWFTGQARIDGHLSSRLTVREKVELSPWAKWSLYGYFPWKLCLHVTLVVLITVQATLVNMHYADYSRAMGRSFVNLFFPPDKATSDVSGFVYRIYSVQDSIQDARRLLDTYFRLPALSVDAVQVATPNPARPGTNKVDSSSTHAGSSAEDDPEIGPKSSTFPLDDPIYPVIRLPRIVLSYHDQKRPADVFVLPNASAPWPLQVDGPVAHWLRGENGGLPEMRAFLDELKSIVFDFQVRSKGWGGGVDRSQEVCVAWDLVFLYDLSVGGQFQVGMSYWPRSLCSRSLFKGGYGWLCLVIGLWAICYQLLLFRSAWERFQILRLLQARMGASSQRRLGDSSLDLGAVGTGPGPPSQDMRQGKGEDKDLETWTRTQAAIASDAAGRGRAGQGGDGWEEGTPLLAARGPHGRLSAGAREGYRTMEAEEAARNPAQPLQPPVASPPPPSTPTPPLSNAYHTLTCLDKLEIFGLWPAVAVLGNTFALACTLQSLTTHVDIFVDPSLRLLLGLACLMLWLALVQYLEFEARHYVMILTLKRAVPRIGQFLFGIAPMFLGYALLGMILFGDHNPYFGSLSATAGTLFCVVNGDSIKAVLDSLRDTPWGIGEIYVSLYVMLFSYVVLMTCIAIVEEAFFSAAAYAHQLWTQEAEGDKATQDPLYQPLPPPYHHIEDARRRGERGYGPEEVEDQKELQWATSSHPRALRSDEAFRPVLLPQDVHHDEYAGSSSAPPLESALSSSSSSSLHYPASTPSSSNPPAPTPSIGSVQQHYAGSAGNVPLGTLPVASPLLPLRNSPAPRPPPLSTSRLSQVAGTSPSSGSSSPSFPSSLHPSVAPPVSGIKRNASGSRVMSAKLRQLIHEADAVLAHGGQAHGAVGGGGGGGYASHSSDSRGGPRSDAMSMSPVHRGGKGEGGGGEGGEAGWHREEDLQLYLSEALGELETRLLRHVARDKETKTSKGDERGGGVSAEIKQAIGEARSKIRRRPSQGMRRSSSASSLLSSHREAEDEKDEEQ